jgi:hypothetical protein
MLTLICDADPAAPVAERQLSHGEGALKECLTELRNLRAEYWHMRCQVSGEKLPAGHQLENTAGDSACINQTIGHVYR